MKRSTLLTTVAALALSTTVAAAQSTQPAERRQTDERTAPSTTNRTNSSPSATSPSTTSPSAQQNTQPSQGTSGSSAQNQPSTSQPSTSQGAQTQQQNQPAATQRSTQGQQTQQPPTSQTQNQPAQSNQQQTQSPTQNNQRSTQGTQQQPSTNQAAQPSTQQPATNQAAQPSNQQSGQAAAITPQQTTQITAAIQQQNVSPVRVNFALNVGVAVPTSVRLAPLPTTIVSIVPAYRGYSYFVTEERIVIVEPRTKKIVHVLPMEGRAAAAPARKQQFTSEQRQAIKKHAVSRRSETTGSSRRVTVEESIPADVELEEFSDVVVREVPSVRSYRYIRRDNDVIVVDPGSRRVIEVID